MKLLILFLLLEIPFDKQLHAVSGMFSSALGYEYVWNKTKDKKKSIMGGIATSLLLGTLKELSDSVQSGNRFDHKDLVATAIGGTIFTLTINILNK